MTRSFNRTSSQVRPIKFITHFTKNAAGSVLCEYGDTKVLCTVSVEDQVPGWMRGKRGMGWLTAEYNLLPGSTPDRSRRERTLNSGRTHEIQRLVGRTLRACIDTNLIGERTLTVDCDVIQADGGTRTAAITGGFVALKLAVDKLLKAGKLKTNPIKMNVAAVSVGLIDGQILVDLDYSEDLKASLDLNVIMTSDGGLLEVQGSAEKSPFTRDQLNAMLEKAQAALVDVFEEQVVALEG